LGRLLSSFVVELYAGRMRLTGPRSRVELRSTPLRDLGRSTSRTSADAPTHHRQSVSAHTHSVCLFTPDPACFARPPPARCLGLLSTHCSACRLKRSRTCNKILNFNETKQNVNLMQCVRTPATKCKFSAGLYSASFRSAIKRKPSRPATESTYFIHSFIHSIHLF